MIWTNKNAADNKIASLSYKPYACFRRDIKDLSYIIIRYKEVYLWLLSMIHLPLVCKLTGTACTRLPSTFTHTQAETIPVRDASTLDNLCRKYEQQRLGLRSRIIRKENVFFRIIQIQNLNKTCVKMLTQKPTIGGEERGGSGYSLERGAADLFRVRVFLTRLAFNLIKPSYLQTIYKNPNNMKVISNQIIIIFDPIKFHPYHIISIINSYLITRSLHN